MLCPDQVTLIYLSFHQFFVSFNRVLYPLLHIMQRENEAMSQHQLSFHVSTESHTTTVIHPCVFRRCATFVSDTLVLGFVFLYRIQQHEYKHNITYSVASWKYCPALYSGHHFYLSCSSCPDHNPAILYTAATFLTCDRSLNIAGRLKIVSSACTHGVYHTLSQVRVRLF